MSKIVNKGLLLIISSPSGAGKTTICKKLIDEVDDIDLSVSVTTRKKRKDELEGKHYFFKNEKEFRILLNENQFLEHANVFGFKYGTLQQTVLNSFKKNKDVLFDIDWQGFQQLKQSNMEVVGIFILPPSKKELINRLKTRGRDTAKEMKKRMNLVQNEISHFPEYDYVVVNKNLKFCVNQIKNIIETERLKRSRLINLTSFVNKFRN